MALRQSTSPFTRFVPALQRLFGKPAANHAPVAPEVAPVDVGATPDPHPPQLSAQALPVHTGPIAEPPKVTDNDASADPTALPSAAELNDEVATTAAVAAPKKRQIKPRAPIPERQPATAAPTFALIEPVSYQSNGFTVSPTLQHVILWTLAQSAPAPVERTALLTRVMQKSNRGGTVVGVARTELLQAGLIVHIDNQYAITPEGIAKLAQLQRYSSTDKAVHVGEIVARQERAKATRLASIINIAIPKFVAPLWITNALSGLAQRLTGEALTMEPLQFAEALKPAVQDVFDLGYAIGSGQVSLIAPGDTTPAPRPPAILAVPADNAPISDVETASASTARLDKDKELFVEFLEGSSINAIAKRHGLRSYSVDKKIEGMRSLFRAGLLDLPAHATKAAKADAIRCLSVPDAPKGLSARHRRYFHVYVEHLQNKSHDEIAQAHGLSTRSIGVFVSTIRSLIRNGALVLPANLVRLAEDDIAKADTKSQKTFFAAAPTGNNNAYNAYLRHLKGEPFDAILSDLNLTKRSLKVYISRMRNAYRLGQVTVPEDLIPNAVQDARTHTIGVNGHAARLTP